MTSRSEKKISYGRNILILLLLMAATFAVIFRGDDFPAFLSALKDAAGRWLLLGLLCMFLFVGCEAANMHQISHTLGFPLKYFRCGQYAFIGFYFSSITPSASGGQPVQIYYMKKDRISLAHSSFMILYIVMVYQMAMLLLAGLMAALHPALAAETAGHLKYLLPFGLAVNGLAAVIGLAVKFSVNLHTALSEFLPDIIGKFNISPVDIRHFPKFCIKFINFLIHVRHLFILSFLLTHVT